MKLRGWILGVLTSTVLMTIMVEFGFYANARSIIDKLLISLGIVLTAKVVSKIF